MHSASKLALATLLIVSAASIAVARTGGRDLSHEPQRIKSVPNPSWDPYGERPTSPGAVPCRERPFALGCDKRGFW